jgi:pimeloyl-ACP methyl ester carboxylesterase
MTQYPRRPLATLLLTLGLTLASPIFAQELPATTAVRHTVYSDGHPLAVWAKAPAKPRGIVVLIHGRTWSSLPDFDLQVPGEDLSLMDGLVEAGYATYAVDLRGYGGTPRDETGWSSPDRAARDVVRVLEWVRETAPGSSPPMLFGWSLGSMVAQLCVQRRPDLVSGVILYGYPNAVGSRFPIQEDPAKPPRAPTTAEAAACDFITEGAISQRAVDAYVEVSLLADPVRVDWYRRHEWTALNPTLVTVPTLLIHGEFDPLTPIERQMMFFALLGTSDREWVVVPGGDHAALLETSRAYFLSAVVGFIERPR